MIRYTICLCIMMCFTKVYGQGTYSITGQITDSAGKSIPDVQLVLMPGSLSAVSDNDGFFMFPSVPFGYHRLTLSHIQYISVFDTIFVDADIQKQYTMQNQVVAIADVVIMHDLAYAARSQEALSFERISGESIRHNLGSSFAKSIERLPGVSSIDAGAGQAKPTIRGVGFNRIAVVQHGVKHEAQQWGADHGLEIDQFAVYDLAVIKGPSSLLYGSDAMAGVITILPPPIPKPHSIGGSVDIVAKSNNEYIGTSAAVFHRNQNFIYRFRTSVSEYADYKVPVDTVSIYSYRVPLYNNTLRNTAGKERNVHATFGYIDTAFQSMFTVSSLWSEYGFFAHAHGLEPRSVDTDLHDMSKRDVQLPYQDVNHFVIANSSRFQYEDIRLESHLGYQQNTRREWSPYVAHGYMPPVFPDSLDFHEDLERAFQKNIIAGSLHATYLPQASIELTTGFQVQHQRNEVDGRGFMIPSFSNTSTGMFFYARYRHTAQDIFQGGVRYDIGYVHTQSYTDWFTSPQENSDDGRIALERSSAISRQFSNISWSAGYNRNMKRMRYSVHIGKSFRMPLAHELASHGINYHFFRYEQGNQNLQPEQAYQIDASYELKPNRNLSTSISAFMNYYSQYIYLNPTYLFDASYGAGNQIFRYEQSTVFQYGAEYRIRYAVRERIFTELLADVVYSEQLTGDKKGYTLPFSPPASLRTSLEYIPDSKKKTLPIVGMEFQYIAAQKRIVPPEEPTPSVLLVHLWLRSKLAIQKQEVLVSVSAQNLFNTVYYNHTGFYRLLHIPEAGRNVQVVITIPLYKELPH